MPPITGSTEIARPPQDVWAYVDDLTKHTEWQQGLERVELQSGSGLGARAKETRRAPGGKRTYTYEVTEHDPPRRMAFRVLDGPIRAIGAMSFAPADDGSHTKVDFELDFEGHGLGKLLLGLARRDASKAVPQNLAQLKQRLESSA